MVKLRAPIADVRDSRSPAPTTSTNEVVFSMVIVSLPVGGMITRIACGSTMRRMVRPRDMPRAAAASYWPWSTDRIPPRTTSAMYAASFSASARSAATSGLISWLVSVLSGPNPIRGKNSARLNQMSSCTSTGVPRNNQM